MMDTIKSLPLTFYSRAFYQHLIRQWDGIGVGFIFILMLLGVASTGLALRAPVHEGVEKIQGFLETLPQMTMKDHKLSIDRPTPYTIKLFDLDALNERNRQIVDPDHPVNDVDILNGQMRKNNAYIMDKIIIDPDHPIGDVDTLTSYMQKNGVFMLITSSKIVTAKGQNGEVQVDDLGSLPDGTLTHENWATIGVIIGTWAMPFILIFSAIFGFISTFILVLFVAVIVKLLGLLLKAETEFDGAMRLAAAAGIPACILISFLPLSFWVRLAVWIGYVIYGLSTVQTGKPAAT